MEGRQQPQPRADETLFVSPCLYTSHICISMFVHVSVCISMFVLVQCVCVCVRARARTHAHPCVYSCTRARARAHTHACVHSSRFPPGEHVDVSAWTSVHMDVCGCFCLASMLDVVCSPPGDVCSLGRNINMHVETSTACSHGSVCINMLHVYTRPGRNMYMCLPGCLASLLMGDSQAGMWRQGHKQARGAKHKA